jgi:hypothetical protein
LLLCDEGSYLARIRRQSFERASQWSRLQLDHSLRAPKAMLILGHKG